MRPKISWSDLPGKHVGIWGLGLEGRASYERVVALGIKPVVVDEKQSEYDGLDVLHAGTGGIEALCECDVVIKSPGISRYSDAARRIEGGGAMLTGGLGLWLESVDRSRVLCVTGTKGKSTTVSIAGHLLERLGHSCFVGGNIGKVPFAIDAGDDWDYWVIEVSSHQVTDLASAPAVVGLTSIGSDHVDWHGSPEQYVRDKLSICTLDGDPLVVAANSLEPQRSMLGERVQWVRDTEAAAAWIDALHMHGVHNRTNAAIARRCLEALGVTAGEDEWARAAEGFAGLAHRLAPAGEINGVRFVDDGLATNVLPTIAALDAFPDERVALLVGGFDRGIDYEPLARHLAERQVPTAVIAMPDSGLRVVELLETLEHPNAEIILVESLEEATTRGFEWAKPSGVVLLSPAAASFNKYGGYAERSAAFSAFVAALR